MRIVHVIAPPPPRQARPHWRPVCDGTAIEVLACHAAIRATPDHQHDIIALGATSARRYLAQLGMTPTACVSMPGGVAELASRSINRVIDRVNIPACAVHCWGAPAWRAVRGSMLADRAVATTLRSDDVPSDARMPASAIEPALGRLVPSQTHRERVRDELGVPEGAALVALLGEPADTIDAWRFVFSLGLAEVCEHNVAAIIGASRLGVRRAAGFHRRSERGFPLRVCPGPIAAWLPACDAAWLGVSPEPDSRERAAGRLWTALAHHHGVPVLSNAADAATDLYPPALRDDLIARIGTNPAIAELLIAAIERRRMPLLGSAVAAHMATNTDHAAATQALTSVWKTHDAPVRATPVRLEPAHTGG